MKKLFAVLMALVLVAVMAPAMAETTLSASIRKPVSSSSRAKAWKAGSMSCV